ncbi:MAG: hypothetical protein IJK23_05435 [Clostridia bacterium]|nr:hypothetical protein [Clostridia bacterium]
MKKIIALVLVMIMALSCVPMSLAADTDYIPANGDVLSGTSEGKSSITINEGVTVYVNSTYEVKTATSLTIKAGGTLQVNSGATLTLNGTATVSTQGTVHNEGDIIVNNAVSNAGVFENAGKGAITNKGNIVGDAGLIRNQIVIPSTNAGLKYHVRVCRADFYDAGSENGLYKKNSNGEVTAINENSFGAADQGVTTFLNDGQSIYFYLEFRDENGDLPQIDPAKFIVNSNGTRVYLDRGLYKLTPDNQAITVSYASILDGTTMQKYYKTIPIYLPSGEGYRVVAYGDTLDQAVNENIDKVVVNYGSNFYFRVEIFDGWQQSNITVTVGGVEVQPDKYGYYEITNITDTLAEDGAYDIYVAGVVKDSTQNMLATIMNTIRNIMETIIDVFKTLFGTLGISLTKAPEAEVPAETTAAVGA